MTEEVGVLVVDDEEPVRRIYEQWLQDYDTYVAANGEEALDILEANHEDIEVVLLDRNMPGMNGDEVLEEIRDRGYDCRVAMVTAISPDYDIIEMPFDDYVTKPLEGDDLIGVIENLRERAQYDDALGEWYSLVSKRAALESEWSEEELEDSEEFQELEERIQAARERVTESMDAGDPESFRHALKEL